MCRVPPRPTLPVDDLYARLEVPSTASPEAIELAWRALLRQHHPDIAGPASLDTAKRINVAHDWLSDPTLRARYDRERGIRGDVRVSGVRAGGGPRGGDRAQGTHGAEWDGGGARTTGPEKQAYASRPRP